MSAWLAVLGACDALAGARVEPVVVTYLGDTVLTRGTQTAFAISVTVDGTSFPDPRLVLSSSDSGIFAVTAGGDSLKAQAVGRATLTVRVESSILTDSMPTLAQPIRVRP
jgi:hypothetical protein